MEILIQGAQTLGIPLTDDQLQAFEVYYHLLIDWNRRFNLTTVTDYREVQIKHFLDSLSVVKALGNDGKTTAILAGSPTVIDVGSGAGFPGLPLKIAFPDLRLTLLEATGKKVDFLQAVIEGLGLAGTTALNGRAEEVAHEPEHREQYDLVVARALASMATLAELTLPFLRVGGRLVAQKGENPAEELAAAAGALATLGGDPGRIQTVRVPYLEAARHLVLVNKLNSTPNQYPRRPGIPNKRPLS